MLIDYNMSKDYCADWTAIDAIREIVQNALDSGNTCNYFINDTRAIRSTFKSM